MFLREIQCFVAVADCLNFTTAANRLYISQPGLSKIISGLENDLKVPLFTRSTRSVRLTEAGEQFLEICRTFMRQCETLAAPGAPDGATLSGNLTIGIGDLNENRYLPQIINEFTRSHPLCYLSIRRYTPEELLGALNTGEVDFGVMISYAIPDRGYENKVYYPSPLMLVVPPTHRLANRDVVRISELKDENFLSIYRNSSQAVNRIHEIWAKGRFVPKIVMETNSLSTMFMLIASGIGVSFHFLLHKDSCNQDIRFIPLDREDGNGQTPPEGAALVWKKENSNPALQAFLDCADNFSRRFQDGPPQAD